MCFLVVKLMMMLLTSDLEECNISAQFFIFKYQDCFNKTNIAKEKHKVKKIYGSLYIKS